MGKVSHLKKNNQKKKKKTSLQVRVTGLEVKVAAEERSPLDREPDEDS